MSAKPLITLKQVNMPSLWLYWSSLSFSCKEDDSNRVFTLEKIVSKFVKETNRENLWKILLYCDKNVAKKFSYCVYPFLTLSWKSIHYRYTLIPACEQYFVYRWDDDMKGAYHSAKWTISKIPDWRLMVRSFTKIPTKNWDKSQEKVGLTWIFFLCFLVQDFFCPTFPVQENLFCCPLPPPP